jgi:hypothetical protein
MDVHLKDRSGTVDFVARAAEFTVSPADLLDRGYRFDSLGGCAEGTIVVPWSWEVRPWTMTKRTRKRGTSSRTSSSETSEASAAAGKAR